MERPGDELVFAYGARAGVHREDLREAVEVSLSYAETLRNLGYCDTGGNSRTIEPET